MGLANSIILDKYSIICNAPPIALNLPEMKPIIFIENYYDGDYDDPSSDDYDSDGDLIPPLVSSNNHHHHNHWDGLALGK